MAPPPPAPAAAQPSPLQSALQSALHSADGPQPLASGSLNANNPLSNVRAASPIVPTATTTTTTMMRSGSDVGVVRTASVDTDEEDYDDEEGTRTPDPRDGYEVL